MNKFTVMLVLLALITSSCSVYKPNLNPKPLIDVQGEFSEEGDSQTQNEISWWETFQNYEINAFIIKALDANMTIRQSLALIKESMALAKQTKSGIFPQISFEAGVDQSYDNTNQIISNTSYGLGLGWELDFFKKIYSSYESEKLLLQARKQDLNAIKLAISSQIADAYFGAIAANQKIDLLKKQIKVDDDLLKLLNLRFENGIGTKVEVLQQQSRVLESKALLPLAKNELNVFENRIDVLIGEIPDSKNRIDYKNANLDFIQKLPQLGVPADLIINRPDIASLKSELISADYEIASAIADRLPQLTLNASYAYRDERFFEGPVSFLVGSFVQPLIDWGQRKAVVEQNKALYEEKLAEFTQSYLIAVEEVENALNVESATRENLKQLNKQIKVLEKAVKEAKARFEQGVDDYQPALISIQELRVVERNLIGIELALVNSRIALYSAIGGNVVEIESE